MRRRIALLLAITGLLITGTTVAVAAVDGHTSVNCTIEANVLSCPLPEQAPITVTETVTASPEPGSTTTVTETTTATETATETAVSTETVTETVTATETATVTAPPATVTVTASPTSATSTPTTTTTTTTTTTVPPSGCDRTATNATTLATQVGAATVGQTICLAAGNYGTWTGTNKAITIRANATANMKVNLGSGDQGFILDGLSGMGGIVTVGAKDFTIRNSTFTSSLDLQGQPGSNILIDGNKFDWPAVYNGGINAKLFVWSGSDGASSGATIRGNSFRNGDLDGVHIGGSAGADILNNVFADLCATDTNHTDMLQTEGMVGGRIAGNLFQAGLSCAAQGLTSYDGGTVGVVIEDNVIDIRRPWAMEWYSDKNSIIRNNTVVYYPPSQCNFNTPCGRIDLSRKTSDPAGSGTQVISNLAEVEFNGGSTGTATGNVSSQGAVFVGPLNTWAGFKLTPDSPGQGAGIRSQP